MKEILPPKVKEIGSSLSEKGKENPEKVNPAEAKEVSKISEKSVFDADIETAKNSSLEAILEENREKKMGLEIAPDDMHEVKEGKEGLSGEQKERLTIKGENLESVKDIDGSIAKEIRIIPDSPEGYHRPYLRKEVIDEIYRNAPMKDGKYLDPNTGLPINGTPDIGHIPGHEHWRESRKAFDEKLTQAEFNARMNNPDFYQLEDPANNRSHKFEDHSEYC